MLAMTKKDGKMVKLSADYHQDIHRAYYEVSCCGYRFEFEEFGPASRVYNKLSRAIDEGWMLDRRVARFAEAARLFGYRVEVTDAPDRKMAKERNAAHSAALGKEVA